MGVVQHVTIPYCPRPQFRAFHDRTQRYACLVAHRRFGKTVGTVNDLIRGALICRQERPRYAYIAPLYTQAKDVAWEYLKHYGLVVPGAEANESELRVDFPNGGRVRLYGADNPDRLRGLYLDGVVFDEYAQMRPQVWPEVIRPALVDRQGWAAFIGTPMGHNAFHEVSEEAKASDDWFWAMLRASETGIIPAAELEAARRAMSEDQYAQEFECSFEAAILGAYYGKILAQLEAQKRLTSVPWDAAVPVVTAWDLGIGDSTAIWFVQQVGQEIHVIDFVENSGQALAWYAEEINQRRQMGWSFAEHLLPHDAEARELGTGKTRTETLASLGVHGRVLPAQKIGDGINAVRTTLPKCWFDAKRCARGLEALKQYRCEFDDKARVFKSTPLHDWTSHAADAFRYLALGLRPDEKAKPLKYGKMGIV